MISTETSIADLEQIRRWNETIPPAVEACVHHLVETQVHDHPDDEAVCSREGALTYRELNAYANSLAISLVRRGIKPGDLISVCFEKSMWTVVAMLAVLKAGVAFVPVPCSPVQRIKTIISLIKPAVILTSLRQATLFTDMGEHVVVVGEAFREVSVHMVEPLRVRVRPSDLAYVLFTSGSTGIPKGAQIEHSQLCTHLKTWSDTVGFDRTSRVFQYSAHTFDLAIHEVFLPLIHGGTLCIPSDDDRMNNITGAMNDMRVTYAAFTPSLCSTFRPEDFDLSTFKTLVIAGEVPPRALLTLWAKFPDVQVFNAYGPTECSIICCAANITRDGPRARNIGRAIGDVLWIVDASDIDILAAIGAVGELLVEGPTVGRGYIGADELSATAFIQAPSWLRDFRDGSDQRLYRTGDLVKYSKDGTIEFVERKDTQVKIRGQRMELGEVEYQLRRALPSRAQVVAEVISRASNGGEPMLVAFICLRDESSINKSESSGRPVADPVIKQQFEDLVANLKLQIADTLASYMVPSAFVAMESMPLLDSSKTDRARLRQIAIDEPGSGDPSQYTCVTGTEKQLQRIWAEAFRTDTAHIGLSDHFVSLGGDSVTAIRLVAVARRVGFSLTVHMLFDHPTVAQLAGAVRHVPIEIQREEVPQPYALLGKDSSLVEDLRREATSQCGVSLDMIQDIYPVPKQYETWMMEFELRAAMKFPLPIGIDLERYLDCWKKLIAAHDMLRTRVIKTPAGMYFVVMTGTCDIRTATNLDTFLAKEKKTPIDFGSALSTYCLVKDSNNARKADLIWTAHHVVYDGWSLGLINAKLRRAYADPEFAITEELKPKQLVQHFQTLDRTAIHEYWRAHYAGVDFKPIFPVPCDRHWDADQALPLQINLPPPNTVKDTSFPISTIITAAWALALSRHSHQADIALAIIRSGRALPVAGSDNYIGLLVTTPPPCHMHIDETAYVHTLMATFQRDFWESTAYEAIGWHETTALSAEAAAACTDPVWLNIHMKDSEAGGREEHELPAAVEEIFYHVSTPLRLECEVDERGVRAVAVYDRSIGSEVVRGIMDVFEKAFVGLREAGEGQRVRDIAC